MRHRNPGSFSSSPLIYAMEFMDGSEADKDLVLKQTFLLYYVNQVILLLTEYFSRTISITKQRRLVSKQGHRQSHIHSNARVLRPQL